MPDGMPVTGVLPISQMKGDGEEESRLLQQMSEQARRYLSGFKSCRSIVGWYCGDGVGGVFAVFFARIDPARPDIDEWLWVIVGDIPPAYLVTDVCCTPKQAMEGYIKEMRCREAGTDIEAHHSGKRSRNS